MFFLFLSLPVSLDVKAAHQALAQSIHEWIHHEALLLAVQYQERMVQAECAAHHQVWIDNWMKKKMTLCEHKISAIRAVAILVFSTCGYVAMIKFKTSSVKATKQKSHKTTNHVFFWKMRDPPNGEVWQIPFKSILLLSYLI